MSGQATGWVGLYGPHPDHVDRSGAPYGGRARGLRMVLLAVADAANREGRHAHPGIENVAGFSLYSQGQCRRLLAELVAEGWLVVTEEGGGRGRATVYEVVMDARNPHVETRASCAGSADDRPSETRASESQTRASEAETRASRRAPNGLSTVDPTEPPCSPPTEHDPVAVVEAPPAECDHRGSCEHFEAFWRRYPRRVNRPGAQRALAAALKLDPLEVILAGLDAWVASWRAEGREDRFLPHPTTWLHQQRWRDVPTAPPASKRAAAEQQTRAAGDSFVARMRAQQALTGPAMKEVSDGVA